MWVCKNLATGEYLTGRLATMDDGSYVIRIEATDVRDRAYTFAAVDRAYQFAHDGCEMFDLCGFEPVEE